MKRKIITASTLILVCSSCVGCIKNPISSEKAKEIALSHANLSSSEVVFIKSEIDYDNGMKSYDVEFYNNNQEYDYKIDAMSGDILEFDSDVEDYTIPQININSNNSNLNTNSNSNNATSITEAKAKEIALKHANLSEGDVTFVKSTIDYDDAMKSYDVEFYNNNIEYDYKIDATNGSILEFDNDVENYDIPQPNVNINQNSSNNNISTPNNSINIPNNSINTANNNLNTSNSQVISNSKAKEIALKHANLSSSQVSYINAYLDYDDGMQTYDVEFYANNLEYNYEINALNGNVLSYDTDSIYD